LFKKCLALSVLFFALPSLAKADLITNGSFTGGSSTGWTASPTPFNTPGYNQVTTSCGTEPSCAVLNDGPDVLVTMTQTISGLVTGTTYELTWDMKSYYTCCGSATTAGAGAGIDGQQWLSILDNNPNWVGYSDTFTYDGGSDVLTFYAQANGTDEDAAFTDIQLNPEDSPVPEPSSFVLMATALLRVGFVARKRIAFGLRPATRTEI
jgi:hypothetical protein